MTVILFLIILAVLVFVHELGHFLAAKYFGIRVDEFAIGFPPTIYSFKHGETKYSLNIIPFGGYVKIFGENPDEDSMAGVDSSRSLVNAAKWKQTVVLLAGIFTNLIFAWILISISFNIGLLTSIDDQYKNEAKNVSAMIFSVEKNSPADLAGIKTNDEILEIQSERAQVENPGLSDIQNVITGSNKIISIEYKRGSATGTISMTAVSGLVGGRKAIGISMGLVGTVQFSFPQSLWQGAKLLCLETENIAVGIYHFILNAIQGNESAFSEIAGPVGIASMVGQARSIGISYLFGFIALISINLAVLNLVPFPAFDGGRVFVLIIEAVIRRKIKPAIVNWINLIGFALIILLMLFITYKDILRLVK
jgi:regulator of sigma E protease